MRAEELLETLTDDELKSKANHCFRQAEDTSRHLFAGTEERMRFLTEADFYLKALIWRQDARIAERDFRLEKWVIALISAEIVLSLIFGFLGLWEGWKQGKALDRQVSVLSHMDTSTAATSDSLHKLVAAQDASLKILQQQQAERAKKPRLALYVGNIPLDRAPVHLTPLTGGGAEASLDLLLKNEGDAPVSTFRLQARVPSGVALNPEHLPNAPEFERSANRNNYYRVTLQLPTLPAGETFRIRTQIVASVGHPPFKILFTVDALELQAVAPLGSLTVLPPKP